MAAKVYSPPEGLDPPEFDDFMERDGKLHFDSEGYNKACDEHEERVREWCKKNSDSDLAGEIISFGVADGKAIYMVHTTKPLTLIHLYYGDGYQIDDMMLRGMRVSDVRRLVGQRKKMDELFGRTA